MLNRPAYRKWVFGLFFVFGLAAAWVSAPSPADAQEASPGTNPAVESLASPLSDAEVRRLLLERLEEKDRGKAAQPEEFNPAVIALRLQRDLGILGAELEAIFNSATQLPAMFPTAWNRFTADRRDGGVMWFFVAFVVSMGLGRVAEIAVRRGLLSDSLAAFDRKNPQGTHAKTTQLGLMLAMRVILLAVFVGVATAVYLLFFDESTKDRIAFLFYLMATGIFRLAGTGSETFFAPRHPALRLPSFSTMDARTLHQSALITVGFGAFGYFTCALFATLGVTGEVHELFLILVGTTTVALLIHSIISGRRMIGDDIAGASTPGAARYFFAHLWPWVFSAIALVMWVALVVTELLRDFVPYGAALFTLGVMAVLPSLDAVLQRDFQRFVASGEDVASAMARGARLALLVAAALALVSAWRINPIQMAGDSFGTQAAGALLQVLVTLLVSYILWQTLKIFIDRKIAEEDAEMAALGDNSGEMEMGGTGMSRMRTLLPLFRKTVKIILGVVVIMISLSSLGIDIGPILAGAGVVGLAVGFGSQTLVRDIVSGIFFLVEDAFRLGEYIDVGEVKGTVEKMSIRSLRLRHHRGAVHTVPFGEVKTLTNYSRDWAIMKLKFRVPFDTDIRRVKNIFKKIGTQLEEHPEIGEDFLQPFKLQGVLEVDDYGLVIRAKFMSKPGKQFMIRKEAYIAVQKAFEENGIEFARPEIRVIVDDDDETDERERANATGAAARLATAPGPVR